MILLYTCIFAKGTYNLFAKYSPWNMKDISRYSKRKHVFLWLFDVAGWYWCPIQDVKPMWVEMVIKYRNIVCFLLALVTEWHTLRIRDPCDQQNWQKNCNTIFVVPQYHINWISVQSEHLMLLISASNVCIPCPYLIPISACVHLDWMQQHR